VRKLILIAIQTVSLATVLAAATGCAVNRREVR
jgi:hypothetical protein